MGEKPSEPLTRRPQSAAKIGANLPSFAHFAFLVFNSPALTLSVPSVASCKTNSSPEPQPSPG